MHLYAVSATSLLIALVVSTSDTRLGLLSDFGDLGCGKAEGRGQKAEGKISSFEFV
jgi:hypothetical protein